MQFVYDHLKVADYNNFDKFYSWCKNSKGLPFEMIECLIIIFNELRYI